MNLHHEVLREIIDLFVDPSSKKRMIYLWEKPKRRAQLLDELLHCAGYFREDRSVHLDPALADARIVAQRMRTMGARQTCFAYGYVDLDGLEVDLCERRYETASIWRRRLIVAILPRFGGPSFSWTRHGALVARRSVRRSLRFSEQSRVGTARWPLTPPKPPLTNDVNLRSGTSDAMVAAAEVMQIRWIQN